MICVTRQPNAQLSLRTTGPHAFALSADSPGFKLLVQVLAASPLDLGYQGVLTAPAVQWPDGWALCSQPVLLRRGSADRACSHVFHVTVQAPGADPHGQHMVLKLNRSKHEVCGCRHGNRCTPRCSLCCEVTHAHHSPGFCSCNVWSAISTVPYFACRRVCCRHWQKCPTLSTRCCRALHSMTEQPGSFCSYSPMYTDCQLPSA